MSPALLVALLGVWLGVLVSVGATAASIFPACRALSPSLPNDSLNALGAWKVIAGTVMSPIFLVVGGLGASLVPAAALFAWWFSRPRAGTAAAWKLAGAFVLVMACAGAAFLLVARSMSLSWELTLHASNAAEARSGADAVAALHGASTGLLAAQAIACVLALIFAVANFRAQETAP